MGRTLACFILLIASSALSPAQTSIPQNARQALVEMFFGKAGSLEKHLPEATLNALQEASAGGPSWLQQLSLVNSQLHSPDIYLQTFEAGSTLLTFEQSSKQTKFDAIVESDDLRGDEDEIVLSFQNYKDGRIQKSPVFPTLTFLMKEEKSVWRLSEISVTVHVPLTDPELLKSLVAGAKARQASAHPMTMVAAMPRVDEGTVTGAVKADEASAIAAMRTIVTAEVIYFTTYGATGYTCSLSDLDGFGQGTPNEHQAMLIESRLASGKKRGYVFALSGCSGAPSTHFRLTAVPAGLGFGRAFCADESGVIRSSADGQAASCLSRGTSLE